MAPEGFELLRGVIPSGRLTSARSALMQVAMRLGGRGETLDEVWRGFKETDRSLGGLLYNAAKLLPDVHALALAPELLDALTRTGVEQAALVDVNFRIDSHGEERFLFDWHQDYWFSMCSPAAVVAWIPLMPVDDTVGGVELISRQDTGGRILATAAGNAYASYADAVRLAEPAPTARAHRFTLEPGDVLLFRFDVLHRSLPVMSPDAARWTLQARFADLADAEFRAASYKPARVAADNIPYLRDRDSDVD